MKARIAQMATAGFSAAAVLMFVVPFGAQAAALTPATAEGDSYGVQAIAKVLTGAPVFVGPVAPSSASVPPGVTTANQSGTVISGPTGPLNPVVSALNVTNDTSKATSSSVSLTDCQPNQAIPDGIVGPLSGGNGCSTIANVDALNTAALPPPAAQTPQITATGVFSQSITQQCDPTQGLPTGSAKVLTLNVFGTPVTIPPSIAPNTTITVPAIATVILNEQRLENLSGGQGLTVNAIHIFTLPQVAALAVADVIIGHSHSEATCTTSPSKQPCDVTKDPTQCHGVIITKGDNTTNEQAKPGQTITFTLSIDTKTNSGNVDVPCLVREVTDTLPPGFAFVSASGDLGTPTSTVGPTITFFNAAGFATTGTLVETIVAKIADNQPGGFTPPNLVDVLSTCAENSGSSKPIFVVVTPTPAASPSANTLPNTGTTRPTGATVPGESFWLGVILLGLVLSAVAAVRMRKEGPID